MAPVPGRPHLAMPLGRRPGRALTQAFPPSARPIKAFAASSGDQRMGSGPSTDLPPPRRGNIVGPFPEEGADRALEVYTSMSSRRPQGSSSSQRPPEFLRLRGSSPDKTNNRATPAAFFTQATTRGEEKENDPFQWSQVRSTISRSPGKVLGRPGMLRAICTTQSSRPRRRPLRRVSRPSLPLKRARRSFRDTREDLSTPGLGGLPLPGGPERRCGLRPIVPPPPVV